MAEEVANSKNDYAQRKGYSKLVQRHDHLAEHNEFHIVHKAVKVVLFLLVLF